jgi:hypothetical protein
VFSIVGFFVSYQKKNRKIDNQLDNWVKTQITGQLWFQHMHKWTCQHESSNSLIAKLNFREFCEHRSSLTESFTFSHLPSVQEVQYCNMHTTAASMECVHFARTLLWLNYDVKCKKWVVSCVWLLLEFDYNAGNRIALRMGLGFSQENAEQIFPIGELLQPKA